MIDVQLSRKVFNKVYLPYLKGKLSLARHEILYGGASSGKSVFIAQKKVYQHLQAPGRKTLVVRKVARTLRHSAFAEIVGVIRKWDLYGKVFRVNKSDMEISRIDGKSQFIFAGLDDVEKLKSVTGITDIWIEEASEVSHDDYKQLNLRMRGRTGFPKQICSTFNPISALSWQKKHFFDVQRDGCSILKTTYRDNQFLSPEDKAEIESLADIDPMYYKIYGLGNWGSIGNLVYTNYLIHDSDEFLDVNGELIVFNDSQIYQGIDWGFNDPSTFLQVAFKDGEIYILDYVYVTKRTNLEFLSDVESVNGLYDETGESLPTFRKDIVSKADSSEPARIKEWRQKGWSKVMSARKGKDSVKFGIDFIRRHKIHIKPTQQEFMNEITTYSYREFEDGKPNPEEPIDFNNHLLDPLRYAFEDLAHERKLKWG